MGAKDSKFSCSEVSLKKIAAKMDLGLHAWKTLGSCGERKTHHPIKSSLEE